MIMNSLYMYYKAFYTFQSIFIYPNSSDLYPGSVKWGVLPKFPFIGNDNGAFREKKALLERILIKGV